ncbi:MAG: sporulation and cell division protein SsgA [Frankiales bacterium]|nr:sporulation and cell division protein SsgA [Frankiales bacterium]
MADEPDEEPRPALPADDLAAPADHVVTAEDGEVVAQVVIADGGVSGRGRLTVLRFGWHPDDPLAVSLRLSAQPDHPALPRGAWTVLRDFLHYGLEEPTGDGEVRIRPDDVRDRVWFELDRLGRPACVSVPRVTVRAFLAHTESSVASGDERSDDAVDALLERLLSGE